MTRSHPWTLLLPALVLIGGLYVLPNLLNFVLAFTDWNTFRPQIAFIGIQNFLDQGSEITDALQTTFIVAIATVILMNVIALGFALALERPGRFASLFTTLLFLPVLLSPLATGYSFRALLQDSGPINSALRAMFGPSAGLDWLGTPWLSVVAVIIAQSWRFYATHMLIYMAALRAVPRELLESARLEGATAFETFWHIKLPMIAPAVTFNVAIVFIAGLSAFDTILALTKGGPGRATQVLNIYVWQQFSTGALGFSTAVSLVLLLAILVTGLPLIALLRRREIAA